MCPFHSDTKPSLTVSDHKGFYKCFSCGAHGDVFDYLKHQRGMSLNQAKEYLGIAKETLPSFKPTPKESDQWEVISPVPDDASKARFTHPEYGEPSLIHYYKGLNGELLGFTARYNTEDGGKKVLPISYCKKIGTTTKGWKFKRLPRPNPLYGLHLLKKHNKVIIVEGEKCVDVANNIFGNTHAVITWIGGVEGVKHADWQHLQTKDVIIWPDFDLQVYKGNHPRAGEIMDYDDQPGQRAALEIQKIIPHARILNIPRDKQKGWDVADALADDGWEDYQFYAFIDQFKPVSAVIPDATNQLQIREEVQGDIEPFRFLGYDDSKYYFFLNTELQVISRANTALDDYMNITQLAPHEWWEDEFLEGKHLKGDSLALIATHLMYKSRQFGIFNPENIRGRGCWIDGKKVVIHAGNKLIVDGRETETARFKSDYIYPGSQAIRINVSKPLSASDANKFMQLCERLLWERPIYATLLAGWCVVAPMCGALDWRPHIWVTSKAGGGKAQPHTSKILTRDGWSTIGEMKVGDLITTPDNNHAKIMSIHPQGKVPVYKITFADGRSTRATGDHLWKVRSLNEWRLKTTSEMIDILNRKTKASISLAIPLSDPLQISGNKKLNLPLHPYVLGAMIGDGHFANKEGKKSGTISLTSYDNHIIDRIRSLMPDNIGFFDTHRKYEFRFGDLSRYGRSARILIKELKLLGARSHNVFIPQGYLDASIEDRIELLKGLMDTDGTIGKNGSLSYCTTSKVLSEQFAYLVRSLGGIALISEKIPHLTYKGEYKEGRLAYVINIRLKNRSMAFSLPRKLERSDTSYQYEDCLYLNIDKIEEDGFEECSCISIDHPDRLYITDDFVVTHNTWTMDHIIKPMIGDMGMFVQGRTTEAGVRQCLKSDAMPVLFDEAESENQRAGSTIESVLALMRQASSETGGKIVKGTAGGKAQSFTIRSCFALSSIAVNLQHNSDISRVCVLSLLPDNSDAAQTLFDKLQEDTHETLTAEYCQNMQARTIKYLHILKSNAITFSAAVAKHLGSKRLGDQIGILIAGAYLLYSSKLVSQEIADEWVAKRDWSEQQVMTEETDETKLMQLLLSTIIRINTGKLSVNRNIGELIQICQGEDILFDSDNPDHDKITKKQANDELLRIGLKVNNGYVIVSNSHEGIKSLLRNTHWCNNWSRTLKRIDGSVALEQVKFKSIKTRAVSVPYESK